MKIRYLLLFGILTLAIQMGHAQITTYDLKKGQAFDLLLFNTNPDTKETLDRYYKSAIPVAIKYGYMPQKGFKVKQMPTRGNYWPSTVIIGLWKNFEKREAFVSEISNHVPDFHEMRRTIWSTFFLTYWEVTEDKTVTIDREKFHVMTAYWMDEDVQASFSGEWLKRVQELGGEAALTLTDGTSPYGYYYNPDFLTITSWENREAFEAFQADSQKLNQQGLRHVNQFIIE